MSDSPLGSPRPRRRALAWLPVGALLALVCAFALWANLDLTAGRPFLFMDEKIAFDGVKHIVDARSADQFWWAVLDGGDHRYGRIFYNVSAAVAWLPYKAFGDPGLIIAVRMAQVAALFAATILLGARLLKSWPGRSLAIAAILCLPFADYYLTQPKPEPLQLLFYALFVWFAVPRHFAFGWHWLFLGLAFGAKISAAPFCAVAGACAFAQIFVARSSVVPALKQGLIAIATFVAGWVIAVPILAVPNSEHVASYLQWTFKSTGHGSDESGVTIAAWMRESFGGLVVRGYIPAWAMGLAVAAALILIAVGLAQFWRERATIRDGLSRLHPWVILALGAALIVLIMLSVKRVWGFYLFPGQVLVIVGLVALAESLHSATENPPLTRRVRRTVVVAGAVCLLLITGLSGKAAAREYRRLASRTAAPEFQRSMAVYDASMRVVARLIASRSSENSKERLSVAYDPFLFLPDSTPDLEIREFWGPFDQWNLGHQAIVLSRTWQLSYFLKEKPLPAPTTANYAAMNTAVAAFAGQVEMDPSATSQKPYQFAVWLTDDAGLILRRDLAERWRALTSADAPFGKKMSP